jgi:hypothetical protein
MSQPSVARAGDERAARRGAAANWAWWAAATAVGGTLGEVVLRLVEGALGGAAASPPAVQVVSWTALGAILGAFQWLVLRGRFDGAAWWIVATALAGSVAYPTFNLLADQALGLGGAAYLLLVMFGLGLIFGLAQSLVLRRWTRWPVAWVVVSALAWPFEHFVSIFLRRAAGRPSSTVGWPELVGWAIYGAATGLVLVWVLGSRRRER